MTDYLIDLASYQEGIDLDLVKEAGVTAVNIKLSQGNWYQWARAQFFINWARQLGLGICTFHWLDNSASGAEQARIVLDLMRKYGVLTGTAHQCDCEDSTRPATWAIWRDYMHAMQDALGRSVACYTGDWWWQPRGWDGSGVTRYVWAGPNSGYLSSYPGDESPHWICGYGGWSHYSLLQYAVQPISGAGGGNLSKTAIRDPSIWAALTGGTMALDAEERNALLETRDRMRWVDGRVEGVAELMKPTSGPAQGADLPVVGLLKDLAQKVAAIEQKVDRISIGGIDYAELAKAVADEQSRRLES